MNQQLFELNADENEANLVELNSPEKKQSRVRTSVAEEIEALWWWWWFPLLQSHSLSHIIPGFLERERGRERKFLNVSE